eukprot:453760_1
MATKTMLSLSFIVILLIQLTLAISPTLHITKTCNEPGSECTISSQCCNSENNGNTKCLFQSHNELGICCVEYNKEGCLLDFDCCEENHVCVDGICTNDNVETVSSYKRPLSIDVITDDNGRRDIHISISEDMQMLFLAGVSLIIIMFTLCLVLFVSKRYLSAHNKRVNIYYKTKETRCKSIGNSMDKNYCYCDECAKQREIDFKLDVTDAHDEVQYVD